jgi:hypothetical protein
MHLKNGTWLWLPQYTRKEVQIGFEVLTVVSTKMAVFWVVPDYTALQPRRQPSLEVEMIVVITEV